MRIALLAVVIAGCGSDLSRDQACSDFATARCGTLMTCSAADLQKRWPDADTCEAREKLACMDALAAPQTANSPAAEKACADALPDSGCAAFLSGVMPPSACLAKKGPRATGAACGFAAQCSTGFCSVADDALCGTCAAPPMPGDSCASSGCGPTMSCVSSTMTCQVPVAASGACGKDLPCGVGLSCVGSTTTTMGTCQPEVATAGAACDPKQATGPNCSGGAGLTCDTQAKTCVAQPLAAANQSCGLIGTVRTACSAGATCSIPSGQTMGVCVAPAADGGACNTDTGPGCQTPAKCVNGSCQLPGSMTCS
jgi:hypothetical protein